MDQLSKKWGDQAAWIFDKNSQPHEAQQLALDSSKANSLLGWKPKLSLEQSLEWTIDWYLKTSKHQDPRLLILDQIEKYTALE